MALNDITFNRNLRGLGQAATGEDHYSAMIFYSDTYPSGFSSTNNIKKIFSTSDAENLGITEDDYSDETLATGGNVLITTVGSEGDTDSIYLDGSLIGQVIVPDGGYATATAEATALKAAINANTGKHGIIASGTTGNVALTLPSGWGKSVSASGKLVFSSVSSSSGTGSGVATVTQFTGGVGSLFTVWYYHIKEFFRMNSKGVLYVGVFPTGTFTGEEVYTMQKYAKGKIRQIAVNLFDTSFASSQITALQGYADTLEDEHQPLSIKLHANSYSLTLSALADISALDSKNVQVILSEDGKYSMPNYVATTSYNSGDKIIWGGGCYQCNLSGSGYPVWNTAYWVKTIDNLRSQNGFSISTIGANLGATSLASVHESTAWVEKFNYSDGTNLDDIGFVTGDLFNNLSTNLLSTLNDEHYVFLRKITGVSGSYQNDTWTACDSTNDYCYEEKNRTMDKAERGVYANVITLLNSPLYVNTDGTLAQSTIAIFENAANKPLEDMEKAGELSGFEVTIDPDQDVLTTSKLILTMQNLPVGVARNIEINSGFTTKLS